MQLNTLANKIKLLPFTSLILFASVYDYTHAVTSTDNPIKDGIGQVKDKFPQASEVAKSTTVGGLIIAVIQVLLNILLAVAVLAIIMGGYMYITSAGKEEQAKKGRQTLLYAIIGLAVIIMARVIVGIVYGTLGDVSA